MSEGMWVLLGVLVGGLITGASGIVIQSRQFGHDRKMFEMNNLGRENAKKLLKDLLNHRTHIDRTFDALQKPIGGFSHDAIRQMLHELNTKQVHGDNGEEYWYLLDRQEERNARRG